MDYRIPIFLSVLIIAFITNLAFSFSNVFALDCSLCQVGNCFCNVTECSSGSLSVYLTQCTGIPIKDFTFTNGSFVWTDSEAKNYYLQVFCDSGTISNCKNVDLTSITTSTTTDTSTSTTTTSTTTTTTFQKLACPSEYGCCNGETNYYNKHCNEGYECIDNQCVITTTSTTTEPTPQINYSLIGGIAILIVVAVFAYYFLKERQPKDKWSELYKKYGRRQ
jgi:hypothetical protein